MVKGLDRVQGFGSGPELAAVAAERVRVGKCGLRVRESGRGSEDTSGSTPGTPSGSLGGCRCGGLLLRDLPQTVIDEGQALRNASRLVAGTAAFNHASYVVVTMN